MANKQTEILPDEAMLALAYTPPSMRDALRIFLEFDARLARIVSATTEPMLGQIRLAWWRDALGMAVSDRPAGDQVLDAIGTHWAGAEEPFVALVDAWEEMLSEPPLSKEAAIAFAKGRGAGLAGISLLAEAKDNIQAEVQKAGQVWALADALSHIAEASERDMLLGLARELPAPGRLPNPYRGIAVLGSLSLRALKTDGAPLMEGRGAALTAMRAGLLGR
ncbi:MAG: squalene/phytoene synthase family protein [Pseudomonadota bacterium]